MNLSDAGRGRPDWHGMDGGRTRQRVGTRFVPYGNVTGPSSVNVVDVQCLILAALAELGGSSRWSHPPVLALQRWLTSTATALSSVTDIVFGALGRSGQSLSAVLDGDQPEARRVRCSGVPALFVRIVERCGTEEGMRLSWRILRLPVKC